MTKELTQDEYLEFKEYIRRGGRQGRIHYSEVLQIIDREAKEKRALQEKIDRLTAEIGTQKNLIKHFRYVIKHLQDEHIAQMVEKEFSEINELINLVPNAN